MGFTEAVKTVLTQKYVTFSGRASRSEYWWFILFYTLVMAVLGGLFAATGMNMQTGQPTTFGFILIAIMAIFGLGIFLPSLAVTIRRMHDRNLSGWWYLGLAIGSAIPFVNIVAAIGYLVLFVMFCMRGTVGPNRFGPDPLVTHNAEVFR